MWYRKEGYTGQSTTVIYASFWRRLLASLVDGTLLALVQYLLISCFSDDPSHPSQYIVWSNVIIGLFYEATMESGHKQATWGKRLLGIKVSGLQGERISIKTAVIRHLAKYLSALLLFVGFLLALFTERNQTLHDMLAGTVVVE